MTERNQNIAGHYETNAREITVTIADGDGTPTDLTGASATFTLKASRATPASEAAVTKTGTQGGDESQISFPDPDDPGTELDYTDGHLVVMLETGDTDGAVDWQSASSTTVEYHYRIDVTDTEGNLVTVTTGPFEILRV